LATRLYSCPISSDVADARYTANPNDAMYSTSSRVYGRNRQSV
jgi:hypothetical protein